MEIRAVVFRMAATTKLLAAPSLEGQAGGVREDDAEFGEQVAPTGKQPLFHEVLAAARRQLAGSGLIGERLAEPSHGAVEMVQLKGLSALDPVVGSPLFGSAVRVEAYVGWRGLFAIGVAGGVPSGSAARAVRRPARTPAPRQYRPYSNSVIIWQVYGRTRSPWWLRARYCPAFDTIVNEPANLSPQATGLATAERH
jgi:hypothetical protein